MRRRLIGLTLLMLVPLTAAECKPPGGGGTTTTTIGATTSTTVPNSATTTSVPSASTSSTSSSVPATSAPTTTTGPTTTSSTTTTQPTTVPVTTTSTVPPSTTEGLLYRNDFATGIGPLKIQIHNMINAVNGNFAASNCEGGNCPVQFMGDHAMNADGSCGPAMSGRTMYETHLPWPFTAQGIVAPAQVYWCANATGHLMSAQSGTGYVAIALTPTDTAGDVIVFPASANRVCWDQNITDLGSRKWVQVSIISAARYQANKLPTADGSGVISQQPTLIYVNPDNAMNAGNAPIISGDDFNYIGTFGTVQTFSSQGTDRNGYRALDVGISDKASRFKTCLTDNGNGTVTRTQNRPDGTIDIEVSNASFPAGPRVFIIGDDSYNPTKAASEGHPPAVTDPFTWHWDNIEISAN